MNKKERLINNLINLNKDWVEHNNKQAHKNKKCATCFWESFNEKDNI